MACFLMVFAFAASASMCDASVGWEARSTTVRQAAVLAERKMEEIRAKAASVPSGSTFAQHLDTILAAAHPPYDDSPSYTFKVRALANEHKKVKSSGFTPPDGVHSPCSSFYTKPTHPGSTDRTNPPYGAQDPGGDFQKNATYSTYPYSRSMPESYRLVQVTVRFGTRADQKVDLVALIGDPIAPPEEPTGGNLNKTVKVVKESGPSNLVGSGAAVYRIEVVTASGAKVDDVSAVWNIHPLSSGSADIFPLDSRGTRVRVTRNGFSVSGTSFRLFPQIRYDGKEARATSAVISL